jgi:hypothetical protein
MQIERVDLETTTIEAFAEENGLTMLVEKATLETDRKRGISGYRARFKRCLLIEGSSRKDGGWAVSEWGAINTYAAYISGKTLLITPSFRSRYVEMLTVPLLAMTPGQAAIISEDEE